MNSISLRSGRAIERNRSLSAREGSPSERCPRWFFVLRLTLGVPPSGGELRRSAYHRRDQRVTVFIFSSPSSLSRFFHSGGEVAEDSTAGIVRRVLVSSAERGRGGVRRGAFVPRGGGSWLGLLDRILREARGPSVRGRTMARIDRLNYRDIGVIKAPLCRSPFHEGEASKKPEDPTPGVRILAFPSPSPAPLPLRPSFSSVSLPPYTILVKTLSPPPSPVTSPVQRFVNKPLSGRRRRAFGRSAGSARGSISRVELLRSATGEAEVQPPWGNYGGNFIRCVCQARPQVESIFQISASALCVCVSATRYRGERKPRITTRAVIKNLYRFLLLVLLFSARMISPLRHSPTFISLEIHFTLSRFQCALV